MVWIGAGVRFEMVSRSAYLGFLNFIRRGFLFEHSVLHQWKFAPDHWIKRIQFWFQQPSMTPAHFTGWVSCADQAPNLISKKRKRGFDGGPGLWSLISLIQTGILLIDFLIRTHSKECCKDQHGCYRELSHRHRIWRIGLVICRMFSFWRTTLHL